MSVSLDDQKNALVAHLNAQPQENRHIYYLLSPDLIEHICYLFDHYPYKDPMHEFEFELPYPRPHGTAISAYSVGDLGQYPAGTCLLGPGLRHLGSDAIRTVTQIEQTTGVLPLESVSEAVVDEAEFRAWCAERQIPIRNEHHGVCVVDGTANQLMEIKLRWV